MLNYHHIAFYFICLNETTSFHTRFTDFYLESVKIQYQNSRLVNVTASLKRSGHENPKLYFEVDLFDAVRNDEGDAKIYYSPLGNRRFMLMPYKVERQSICDLFETKVVHQIVHSLQNYSNVPLPVDKNVQFCELLTLGHYYAHNFDVIDKSIFPPFTPTGRFRWVGFVYEKTKKEILQSIEFVATFV